MLNFQQIYYRSPEYLEGFKYSDLYSLLFQFIDNLYLYAGFNSPIGIV